MCILFVSKHVPAPVDKEGSQGPQRGVQGPGSLLKIRPVIRELEHTLYLTHKYFPKVLLTNGAPKRERRAKRP